MNRQPNPSCYIKLESHLAEEADALGIDVEQAAQEGVRAALMRLRSQASTTPPKAKETPAIGSTLVRLSDYRNNGTRLSD